MSEERVGGPLQSARGAFAGLTDGQRWTVGLVALVTVLFVGFGLRRAPVLLPPLASGAMPAAPASAVTSVASGVADGATAPGVAAAGGRAPTRVADADAGPDAEPEPEPEPTAAPEVIAVVGHDADVAEVFLDVLPRVRTVQVDSAAAALCGASSSRRLVVAGEGLAADVRDCVIRSGAVLVSHDDRGSSATVVSTALGATAAFVEAAQLIGPERSVGLVVGPDLVPEAEAAAATLEAQGYDVETAVLDGTDLVATSSMLAFVGSGVESVVLGVDVAQQDRWLAAVGTLRLPFDHVVADVADSITAEAYDSAPSGLRAVAATRGAWFAREHGETDVQHDCRERFEAATGAEEAADAALASVYLWCQHVDLADAILAAGLDLTAAFGEPFDSPMTSPLVRGTPTGYGPGAVAVLAWEPACSCWVEATAYATRTGVS